MQVEYEKQILSSEKVKCKQNCAFYGTFQEETNIDIMQANKVQR